MDVVTIGETMIQFTPKTMGYMRYATDFSARIAGAESNVAIGLARLGHKAAWISRISEDEFGKKIISFLKGEGVDTSHVQLDASAPTGLYFKEMLTKEQMRIQYYRQRSAASQMTPADLNEEYIAKAKYMLITGITPALSESCYQTIMKAIEIAEEHKVTIVFDPNIRRKLWSDNHAKRVLLEIIKKANIVLPGIDEGKFLFGIDQPEKLAEKFYHLGPTCIGLKLGPKGAYYLSENQGDYISGYPVKEVVDPVGAGDGFATGVISALLDQLDFGAAIKRGNAIGAMVTMVEGDVEGLPDRMRLTKFMNQDDQEDVIR